MKRLFLGGLALLLSSLFLQCDRVDDPLVGDGFTTPSDSGSEDSLQHRVLLEEFTGVKCNNCPAATKEAKRLQARYGDRLILLGIHAGNLATTDEEHPKAFRTPEGNQLFSDFSLFGVPVGFVDRMDYSSGQGSLIKNPDDWAQEVARALNRPLTAEISLQEESYDPENRQLTIQGAVKIHSDSLKNLDTYLCVYLAENDIISAQTMGDKSVNPNYEHDHVFRGSMNSTYGKAVDFPQDTADFSYTATLDPEIVKGKLEVIAFIYNRADYQILETAQLRL